MQSKKIILIVISLIIIIFVGFYLFFNNFQQKLFKSISTPSNEEAASSIKPINSEKEIKINDDGFEKDSINIKEEIEFSIMNYSNNTVVLVNKEFFPEGHVLEKNTGVGFPGEGIKNQQFEKLIFWLQSNPKEKLKINIIK